ncbi:diacylglycerol acyltransferase-domain-containing protein [Microdochium bolleyi]|uniref:Diacylglycerol O-acyltransferase n=1 Tax=Microdochium bolleyi TaxID=196109 RepID=A0A136IMD1_9PEZI|nr:diacylglycerol acyltransferase-domain-containing protein [Microdochium bolleyi]
MATVAPHQVPSPPQSVKDDTIKVQTVTSDPRLAGSEDAQGATSSKEGSFIHVGNSKEANGKESPAPTEVYGSEKPTAKYAKNEKAGTTTAEDDAKQKEHINGLSNASRTSYAAALKKNTHLDDDDDSYPDLDDMGAEMVHRPPKPKKKGGIRWVPLNVPFQRRGQTLAVLLHSLCIVITVSFFCACCANPFVWPLLLFYLLHVLNDKSATDGSLRFRSERFRRSYLWHLFAGYFPAKLHKTHELEPTRKYIFGYHPHGIISHGAWAAFTTDALNFSGLFPGITNTLLTLDSNFRVPFYRDYLLAMGMRSVSRESIVNILTRGGMDGEGMGRGVTVVVGGARESLEAIPGNLRLILKERKGFVKIAVRTGADLVPVLAFGENSLYDQLEKGQHPMVHRLQMFILKVWKFTLPFMHGRGIFNYDVGMMPYRHPLNVVVGAPIKVVQSANVDMGYVDELHELYVTELEKLWDRYKDEFALDRKEEMQLLS